MRELTHRGREECSRAVGAAREVAKQLLFAARTRGVNERVERRQPFCERRRTSAENLASTRDVEKGGERLNVMARELEKLVTQYRL